MGVRGQLGESWSAFLQAFRTPALRQLQLAGVGSTLAPWTNSIAIAVYAYRADGPKAVGIVLFVRWSFAAVFSPWLSVLADRLSRRRVMLVTDLTRASLVAAMTLIVLADGPSLVVYTLAVVVSVVSTAFVPAQAALLPSLASTPEELTASNLALNTISSVGMFAGPALGGLFLAIGGVWLVFALVAAAYFWSAVCVFALPHDEPPEQQAKLQIGSQLLGGFRAIGEDRRLQVVLALLVAETLVVGAFEVVTVIYSIRILGAGNAGVGWLNTALGIGALVGGLVGIALTVRKRLAADMRLGLLLYGAAILVLAATNSLWVGLLLFALMGVGSTLVDVAGTTVLQRSAPPEVVGRVFGVLRSLMLITVATGSLVTPLLVSTLGVRETVIAAGVVVPLATLLTWRTITAIDATAHVAEEPLALLRAIPIFTPLPLQVAERLASLAVEVRALPQTEVVSQGEHGDRFYVIAEGEAAVSIDGVETSRLGAGDFFGEIALLRDVPRTATVTAVEPLRMFAVERDDFIAAVTGHAPSREAAESVVTARLPAGVAP